MPEWAIHASEWVLITLLAINAKLLYDLKAEVRSLREFLFGPNGDNGLNSRVKALESERQDMDKRLNRLEAKEAA